MLNTFWKIMPVLTLLGLGTQAEVLAAKEKIKVYPAPAACGINDTCLARSCSCAMGGALEADFLYWRAENTGYVFAFDERTVDYKYSMVRLPAHWAPGLRVGAGWNTNFDKWDVFTDWTWFKDHSSKSISTTTSNHSLLPLWFVDQGFPCTRASGGWHVLHNMFDLELGRAFYLTKALSFRTLMGLRGGWIHQKFTAHLINTLTPSYQDFDGKNNFWGMGPRIGFHSQWHIANSHWSLLGKASGTLLLGQTKVHSFFNNTHSSSYASVDDHFSQMVPNVQLFLGLDWGSCLSCDKYYLGLNAGWEANYYWNQFNLASFLIGNPPLPIVGNNAIEMSGLTFNVHFDF